MPTLDQREPTRLGVRGDRGNDRQRRDLPDVLPGGVPHDHRDTRTDQPYPPVDPAMSDAWGPNRCTPDNGEAPTGRIERVGEDGLLPEKNRSPRRSAAVWRRAQPHHVW
jgi:hypothetical protein